MTVGVDIAASPATVLPPPIASPPAVAAAHTGTGELSEKTLELTFCSQFAASSSLFHWPFPPVQPIVWFGLTQLQESRLGFDAVSSLGGRAIVFQFKASHTVTRRKGRRFKVDHDQMQTLRTAFGHTHGNCFYIFPNIGTITELTAVHSDVVGNTWIVDAADLPGPTHLPYKHNSTTIRRADNCHYVYLNARDAGTVTFHSQPIRVNAYRTSAWIKRHLDRQPYDGNSMGTEEVIERLKRLGQTGKERAPKLFRNMALAVLPRLL